MGREGGRPQEKYDFEECQEKKSPAEYLISHTSATNADTASTMFTPLMSMLDQALM
jgi:hypothetical protein